ncbi:MAG TPA: hypothetical protein VFP93_01485 [Gammaproteobacteria bacterium]|nr:hypothetical protein [Gammaproteobacteria bacterium]
MRLCIKSWMAAFAAMTPSSLKPRGRLNIFFTDISECYKELISYLWIALNEETIKLEDGFTV